MASETRSIFEVKIRRWNSRDSNETLRTLWVRWNDRDGDPEGIDFDFRHDRDNKFKLVTDPIFASDMSKHTMPEKPIAYFHMIKNLLKPGEDIVVRNFQVTTTTTDGELDKSVELEWLRQQAFSKLTRAEVDALGVGDIAAYHKLKYHP